MGSKAASWVFLLLRLGVGGVLIYASIPKIAHPGLFADTVANYRLLPAVLDSWVAVTLPWLELFAGLCLVFGAQVRVAGLAAAGMFCVFVVALTSAGLRHLDISCGCLTLTAGQAGGQHRELWLTGLLAAASIAALALSGAEPRLSSAALLRRVRPRRAHSEPLIAVLVLTAVLAGSVVVSVARQPRAGARTEGAGVRTSAGIVQAAPTAMLVLGRRDLLSPRLTAKFQATHPAAPASMIRVMAPDQVVRRILDRGLRPDVVDCALDQAPLLVAHGILQALDLGRLGSGASRVAPAFLRLPDAIVGNRRYVVPVDAAKIGIIYREDQVHPAPTSFRDLLRPEFKGRTAVQDDVATGIRLGALMLGWGDRATFSPRQLATIRRLMEAPQPYFVDFYRDSTELEGLFRSGLLLISTGDAATARRLRAAGLPVRFAVPKEGLLLRVRGLAIGAGSAHANAAHALLSYYLTPGVQALDARLWGVMTSDATHISRESFSRISSGVKLTLVTAPHPWPAWESAWTEVVARSGHS